MMDRRGVNGAEATSTRGACSSKAGKSSSATSVAERQTVGTLVTLELGLPLTVRTLGILVPAYYFSHLDMSQRRMDLDERSELRFGSVDFLVGKEYWVQENQAAPGSKPREPVPLNYIFAIDVSWTSARCGLVGEVVKGLRELLYPTSVEGEEAKPCGLPHGSKIGIITFDRTVQYFNLKVSQGDTENGRRICANSLECVVYPRSGTDARCARH